MRYLILLALCFCLAGCDAEYSCDCCGELVGCADWEEAIDYCNAAYDDYDFDAIDCECCDGPSICVQWSMMLTGCIEDYNKNKGG